MSLMYADTLDDMLTHLEGRVFGPWFRFGQFGYCYQLSVSLPDGNWNEVKGFRDWPRMREFSDELNSAIQPVVEKYAKQMRQDLANELVKVAAQELQTTKGTDNAEEIK